MFSAEEAKKAGCIFYSLPSQLDMNQVDPLMQKCVKRINESGWVWTAESCQGHPEAAMPAWAGNTRPMLRLVTHGSKLGDLMAMIYMSMFIPQRIVNDVDLPETSLGFEIFPSYRKNAPYVELLLYIPAYNVYERNTGITAFEQLAELVNNPWKQIAELQGYEVIEGE